MSWQEDFVNMSEVQKKMLVSDGRKDNGNKWWGSLSDEEKEAFGKKIQDNYNSRPFEEKERLRQQSTKYRREYFSNRTQDEVDLVRSKISKANLKRWASISPEVLEAFKKRQSEDAYRLWANRTEDELKDVGEKISRGREKYMESLSIEDKARIYSKVSESNYKRWAGYTLEERKKIGKRIKEGLVKHFEGLSPQERADRKFVPNSVEVYIRSILDSNFPGEWKYTGDKSFWVGTKNPDFTNINGKKAVIEHFGQYYHNPEYFPNSMSEEDLIAYYKEWGFDCVVLWEDLLCADYIVEKVSELYG